MDNPPKNENLFPEEWGWKKYEPAFREWATRLAPLLMKEEQKDQDDENYYPDYIQQFVLEEQHKGNLPTDQELVKKGEALEKIQDELEAKALQKLNKEMERDDERER